MVVSHNHSYLCELVVSWSQDFCWQYHLGIFWNSCSWPFRSKEDFSIFPLLTILTRDRILNVLDWVATKHTIPHSHIPWRICRRDKVVHILDYWNMASLHWRNYLVLHQMQQNKFSEVLSIFIFFLILSSLVHESCFSNYLHSVHGATKERLGLGKLFWDIWNYQRIRVWRTYWVEVDVVLKLWISSWCWCNNQRRFMV